jgi:hypothetical protein
MSYLERHSSENEPFKQHTAAQKQQAAPTPAQGDIESDKSVVEAVQEKFVLHITAKEDTWMKVIVDNRDPKEYNLASGDGLELEASSKFNLLIGNAGGVTLRLNDKEIPVVGKNGEMVNLDLP